MKKLSIMVVLILVVITGRSQSFEGTIKWTMKMEITDPKMKAQMEEAKKKLNDPATQAQMKEMQAKMNDPQMKAMMDANPQMKTQMETAMKMMQGGNVNSMIPTGMILQIKGGNTLTKMEGGIMDKAEILYEGDKNKSVRIDHANKTYTPMNTSADKPEAASTAPKVTKTSETKKILNYTCTKYIVESTDPRGKATKQVFWTTKEIDIDMKKLAQHRMRDNQFFYENIDGVPLRTEVTMPEGNMTMEVTDVKKESLSSGIFQIPAGYKEVKGMGF